MWELGVFRTFHQQVRKRHYSEIMRAFCDLTRSVQRHVPSKSYCLRPANKLPHKLFHYAVICSQVGGSCFDVHQPLVNLTIYCWNSHLERFFRERCRHKRCVAFRVVIVGHRRLASDQCFDGFQMAELCREVQRRLT